MGAAGRTPTAGRVARGLGSGLVVLAALAGVVSLLLFWHDGDLRDLGTLQTTSATVTDRDDGRRGADYLEVTFTPAGRGEVSARIPSGANTRVGGAVEVAYRAQDPSRVRTVADWSPAWASLASTGGTSAAIGLPVLVFGLLSRFRRGRFEGDTTLPAAVHDVGLGARVVRSGRWVPVAPVGFGFVLGAFAVVLSITVRDELLIGLAVGALLLGFCGAFAGVIYWYQGRDGVWATPTELVARRRGRERRWPWAQVVELGVVVQGGPVYPTARLDDGVADHIGTDGWVTLAKPLLGPAAKWTATRRIEELATEHGLPFTEGLTSGDLSDGMFGPLRPVLRRRR